MKQLKLLYRYLLNSFCLVVNAKVVTICKLYNNLSKIKKHMKKGALFL